MSMLDGGALKLSISFPPLVSKVKITYFIYNLLILSFAEIWACENKTKPVNLKNCDVSEKECFFKHVLIFGWYFINLQLIENVVAAFILILDLFKTSFLDVDHLQVTHIESHPTH